MRVRRRRRRSQVILIDEITPHLNPTKPTSHSTYFVKHARVAVRVLTKGYDEDEEAKHISETRFLAEAVRQGEEGVVAYEHCQQRERQLAGGVAAACALQSIFTRKMGG